MCVKIRCLIVAILQLFEQITNFINFSWLPVTHCHLLWLMLTSKTWCNLIESELLGKYLWKIKTNQYSMLFFRKKGSLEKKVLIFTLYFTLFFSLIKWFVHSKEHFWNSQKCVKNITIRSNSRNIMILQFHVKKNCRHFFLSHKSDHRLRSEFLEANISLTMQSVLLHMFSFA